jgi:hypothetical protein
MSKHSQRETGEFSGEITLVDSSVDLSVNRTEAPTRERLPYCCRLNTDRKV